MSAKSVEQDRFCRMMSATDIPIVDRVPDPSSDVHPALIGALDRERPLSVRSRGLRHKGSSTSPEALDGESPEKLSHKASKVGFKVNGFPMGTLYHYNATFDKKQKNKIHSPQGYFIRHIKVFQTFQLLLYL